MHVCSDSVSCSCAPLHRWCPAGVPFNVLDVFVLQIILKSLNEKCIHIFWVFTFCSCSFFLFHVFVLSLFLGASMRFRAAALASGFKLPISHLAGLYKLRVTRSILFLFSISAFEVKTNWPLFDVLREANFRASVCLGVAVVRLRYPCSARCEHAQLPCAPLVDVDH